MLKKNPKNTIGTYTLGRYKNIFYYNSFILPAINTFKNTKGKILDIGCGNGKVTVHLINNLKNIEFSGLDINKFKLPFKFVQADAHKIPFNRNSFNGVTMFEVLEHVDNPELVIKQVNKILKKGGVFYLTTPLEGDINNLYGYLCKTYKYDPHKLKYGHINKFSKKYLTKILAKNNFKIINETYTGHYINQIWTTFLNLTKLKLIPITVVINILSGLESMLFRKYPHGLDIQITAIKK